MSTCPLCGDVAKRRLADSEDQVTSLEIEEVLAAQELARIMPSREELEEMARLMRPSREWFEGNEE